MKIKPLFLSMLTLLVVAFPSKGFSKNPEAITDLGAALEAAKAENKLVFIKYGREACGNCQALHGMIEERDVKISQKDFVFADINCDDKVQRQLFRKKYTVEGKTLPFVVIAGPDGAQIASRSGYAREKVYKDFIKAAKKVFKSELES